MKKLARFDEGDLHEQFEELVVAVWGIIMRGALDFLNAISSETHLPLGAREVFLRELRTLNDAHLKLSEERYKKRLSDDTEKVMQTAERILEEVIEKVPALLRF